ncbi:MAG: transposase, partial [Pirellulales bacterium]
MLTNVAVWSSDSRWIVYDTRSSPDGSGFDGTRIERVVVVSCKCGGACPSCNGRHMAQTAAQIFLDEIERLLCAAAGVTEAANTPTAACPRLGAVSFLHRFGSALNHHVHLHACVTDGVFRPAAAEAACDTQPAFLPAWPITHVHLAALGVWLVFYQEKVPDPFWAKGKRDRHRLLTQTEPVPAAAAA